jgi:hypothetical protein
MPKPALDVYEAINLVPDRFERMALTKAVQAAEVSTFRVLAYATALLPPESLRGRELSTAWRGPAATQKQFHHLQTELTAHLLNQASAATMFQLTRERDYLWCCEQMNLLTPTQTAALYDIDDCAKVAGVICRPAPEVNIPRLCVLLGHPWWRCACQQSN